MMNSSILSGGTDDNSGGLNGDEELTGASTEREDNNTEHEGNNLGDESFEVTDSSIANVAATGEHELPLLVNRDPAFTKTGEPAIVIEGAVSGPPSPSGRAGVASDFDTCREYSAGYRYDVDSQSSSEGLQQSADHDDDPLIYGRALGDSAGEFPSSAGRQHVPSGLSLRPLPDWSAKVDNDDNESNKKNGDQLGGISYLLGRSYHPAHDFGARRDDEASLLWMTYRREFPVINPYGISSDAGWGCMLRSAQMMLCQALRMHFVGRDWRPPKSFVRRREDAFVRDALTWFADYPTSGNISDSTVCKFSLHNMVAAGFKYEMLPGEWYGPQTACHVIKDLCEMESRSVKDPATSDFPLFRVHVAQEGSVYRDAVDNLMTRSAVKEEHSGDLNVENDSATPANASSSSDVGSGVIEDPLLNNPANDQVITEALPDWDTSLLLLIPLRLGLKTFNADTYRLPLAHTFSLRQSVGFLGGTPRHALFFYGASSNGEKIFGLDPHTVQDTPQRQRLSSVLANDANASDCDDSKGAFEIVLSDDYLRSVHCTYPSTMEMARIDPSLALAFYCRNRADFDDLCAALEDMKTEGKKYKIPELFCVADASPDYCANVSSSLVDMMMTNSIGQIDCCDDNFDVDDRASDSEDEEYVML